jgi:hypothetical protein
MLSRIVASFDYFAHASGEDTRLMAGYRRALDHPRAPPRALRRGRRGPAAVVRVARNAGGQLAGIGGAIAASAACFGAPVLVSAATAIGATALTSHATLYPIFVGAIVLSLWQLHRSSGTRDSRFFWFGSGGITAVVLWFISCIVPLSASRRR